LSSDAIREQVLAANRRFYDALEALDMDAMEAVWGDGAEVACLHPGGPWQRGWEDVRAGWEAIMANTGYIELDVADVVVSIADPVAWVTCTEVITSAAASGEPAAAEVAATNVFVLDRSGWRLVLHHASPVIRPAPAEAE
jgi:ketosteroid isomerase-like protein